MTVSGTQTSRWAYDRTHSEGSCVVLDSGSGNQTLRFRSVRAHKVRQVWWKDGYRELLEQGRISGGLTMPIRIDAVRDSVEDKGGGSGCGDGGGDEPSNPTCTRRGSVVADLLLFFDRNAFTAHMSSLSFGTPSTLPDCPVEMAIHQRDPLDLLDTPAKRRRPLQRRQPRQGDLLLRQKRRHQPRGRQNHDQPAPQRDVQKAGLIPRAILRDPRRRAGASGLR